MITLRQNLNRQLTSTEADGNIQDLDSRIKAYDGFITFNGTDPRARMPYQFLFFSSGLTREPVTNIGNKIDFVTFPFSNISGTLVTLHEWQKDTVLLADTVSILPRLIPVKPSSNCSLTTGTNVNVVAIVSIE